MKSLDARILAELTSNHPNLKRCVFGCCMCCDVDSPADCPDAPHLEACPNGCNTAHAE